jgi:hypothetical protein
VVVGVGAEVVVGVVDAVPAVVVGRLSGASVDVGPRAGAAHPTKTRVTARRVRIWTEWYG